MNASLFQHFHTRYRFEGQLLTRTGLHIGAGSSLRAGGVDAPVVRDAAGNPFIPGSSLKGVLRSTAEAWLRSPGPRPSTDRLWACHPGQPCLPPKRQKDLRNEMQRSPRGTQDLKGGQETSKELAEALWKESCSVCRLFGSDALASRVRFPDLALAGDHRPEVRWSCRIDRETECANADGALFDYEVVPAGTTFRLTTVFDNCAEWEIGWVLALFEQLDAGDLTLGGKSSRGLGQTGLIWQKWTAKTRQDHQILPHEQVWQGKDLAAATERFTAKWRQKAEAN